MKTADRKQLVGVATVGVVLFLTGTASAWYGDPWYRPYGSGAVTYERQNMMRTHGYAMDRLADMFERGRVFDRDEAVRLARELEAGFGDSLIKNFAPGTVVAGSRTSAATWNNFGLFRGYARAAEQSSARLAEALEKNPTGQDVRQTGVRGAPWRMGYGPGPWGRQPGSAISMDVIREYSRLGATCQSCHAFFRGWRR